MDFAATKMDSMIPSGFSSHGASSSIHRHYSAHAGAHSGSNASAEDHFPGSSQISYHVGSSHYPPIAIQNHWKPQTLVSWETPQASHGGTSQAHSSAALPYPADSFGNEDPHRAYEAAPVVYNGYLDQRDGYYGSQTSEEKQYVSRAAAEMLLSLKQITFPEEGARHQPHGYAQGAQYEHRPEPYEYIPHYPQVQPVSVNFQMTMSCISGVASVPSHYNRPPTVNSATSKPFEPPKRKPHSNGHSHSHSHSALQYHRASSHYEGPGSNEKVNICAVCRKSYARPSTLKTHMRTHSGEKPYMCHLCPKTFTQAANLTAHGRTHSGEKPFRCPVCERRFSQSSSVTTHMRTHSGERPYRCRVCKKAFSDSSTLTKHIRIHSGEKPYQCHLCMLRFSQSGNLNRHMKVHLAERQTQN